MSNEGLKTTASLAIQKLFSTGKIRTPISSFDLLRRIISLGPIPPAVARFRLPDLEKLDAILTEFSDYWNSGTLSVVEDKGEVCVVHISLANPGAAPQSRKRKRVLDEDADSAEEEEANQEELARAERPAAKTALDSLSRETREIYALLQQGTARGRLLAEEFRSVDSRFEPICEHITKEECARARSKNPNTSESSTATSSSVCDRIHFRPLIRPHTDPSLGHCSYLNTCYSEPTYAQSPSIPPLPSAQNRTSSGVSLPSGLGAGGRGKEKAPCRYLHFEVDYDGEPGNNKPVSENRDTSVRRVVEPSKLGIGLGPDGKNKKIYPPQWINCDLRRFDYSILGKFHVIMADPPWDIHMSLPYGTMTDDEMRAMPIPMLQDEGLLFLWVTGRAMEVGRECMRVWGYTRVDEVIWVKVNQLQRVIRTGRTGHWLNHTKEHMLVGVKTHWDSDGNLKFPSWCNRGLDTDVIVSEVRETSRKPDEVYGIIERMCPGGRKVEIFGRKHNTRPGWLTLGNQLGQDQIYEEDLKERILARYPERNILLAQNNNTQSSPSATRN